MLKLAILAKEGISIDDLREDPPEKVTLPPHEANVENSTTQSEIDLKTLNDQLMNTWLNSCQKIGLAGKLCGDKFCDNKAVSLTYLSLGMDERQIFVVSVNCP